MNVHLQIYYKKIKINNQKNIILKENNYKYKIYHKLIKLDKNIMIIKIKKIKN